MEERISLKSLKNKLYELIGKDYISLDDYSQLPKWKMVESSKILGKIRNFKFKRRDSLLGELEKAMPEKIFKKLMDIEKREKVKLAILIQGLLALRISEVVILKVEHFDFESHLVRVFEPKTNRMRHIPICHQLEKPLIKFITKYSNQIKSHNRFILFSENVTENRDHLSLNWLRNEIEKSIEKTGLQKIYATDSAGKNRHLYTSHSLRGYGIMKFHNMQLEKFGQADILLTQKFAGHTKIENTLRYVTHDFKKIYAVARSY